MSLVEEIDYGTPRSRAAATVSLTIDGAPSRCPKAPRSCARRWRSGRPSPSSARPTCWKPSAPAGSAWSRSRAAAGTPASCTTPVADGMVVRTQTDRLKRLRKGTMELYISDHPLDCLTCCGQRRLRAPGHGGRVGLREVRYGYAGENHPDPGNDDFNPYFTYDPSKCIVCSRCVRACEEVQGTFALTIAGRGFDFVVSPGMQEDFLDSECVSCGACVQACPTATLTEKSVIEIGQPEHSVVTTCAYCGVGCSFKAEMRGEEVVRMVPYKDGKANRGHSCVKGRFAWGYATHQDRILKPMIRDKDQRPVARSVVGRGDRPRRLRIHAHPGDVRQATRSAASRSSRCTNEETFLVQKLVRAGFGNNNVDTCARVCHSPTGYGLKTTFGTSAGTQDFDSVEHADVIVVIGANPTDAHPVFASRMKKRLRQGAKLIVIDPRRIDLVRTPHVEAAYHLPLLPGTNVAVLTALAHVIVTEGLVERGLRPRALRLGRIPGLGARSSPSPGTAPRRSRRSTGVPAADHSRRGPALRHRRQRRDLLRPRRHRAQPGLDHGDGDRQPRHGDRQHRPARRRREPAARPEQCAGRLRHGLVPARAVRLPPHLRRCQRASRSRRSGAGRSSTSRACASPTCSTPRSTARFKGIYIQGEDILQSDPDTQHVAAGLAAMECVVVQDLFLNETANYAHVFLPGSTFLEKDGTFTNAERRIQRVRKVMAPKNGMADWEITLASPTPWAPDALRPSVARSWTRSRALTPTFAGVSFEQLDELGSIQWPCNDKAPGGHAGHAHRRLRARQGQVRRSPNTSRPTSRPARASRCCSPPAASSANTMSARRRGAPRTSIWHEEDVLEIHPHDAEQRGVRDGDWVGLAEPRRRDQPARHDHRPRRAGRRLHDVPPPGTQANVVTTDYSDWATNCPEYKVTAVQVTPSNGPTEWQAAIRGPEPARRRRIGHAVEPAE